MVITGKNESLDCISYAFDDGVEEVAKQKNKALQKVMIDAELTQTSLAELAGLHLTNVNGVVNGSLPHLRTAQKIVRALNSTGKVNVTIDELWPLPEEVEK